MSTVVCVVCKQELFNSKEVTTHKVFSGSCGHLLHSSCLEHLHETAIEVGDESFLPWKKPKRKCPECGKKVYRNKYVEIFPTFSGENTKVSTEKPSPVVIAGEVLNTNEVNSNVTTGPDSESWEKYKALLESEYVSKKQHLEALYQQLLKKTQIQDSFAREKESNQLQLKFQLDELERDYERTQNHLESEKRRIQQQQHQKHSMASQSQELRRINREIEQNRRTFESEQRELEQKQKYLEYDSSRQTELNRDKETIERKVREKQSELDGLKKRLNAYLKTPLP